MNKTWAFIGIGTLFIVVVLFLVVSKNGVKQDGSSLFTSKRIKASFEIVNEDQHPVNGLDGWLWLPSTIDGRQAFVLESSSVPFQLHNVSGFEQAMFELPFVAPYSRKRVDVQFSVRLAQRPVDVNGTEGFEAYQRAESLIELTDPQIVALANSLQAKEPIDTASQVFEWIRANVKTSPYRIEPKSATSVLESKTGDCTDQMLLAAALMRALKIPTRLMAGYLVEQPIVKLDSSMYHNWAEILVDNEWRIVDPQRGVFDDHYDDYVVYGTVDSGSLVRPRFGLGDEKNIAIKML